MQETHIPKELIEYLDLAAQGEASHERAQELFDKYKPRPKTLADLEVEIVWSRVLIDSYASAFSESIAPAGLNNIEGTVGLLPWPEQDGIDPAELLNDGWQIRQRGDVPQGWAIAKQLHHGQIDGAPYPELDQVSALLVFCRPPEGNAS